MTRLELPPSARVRRSASSRGASRGVPSSPASSWRSRRRSCSRCWGPASGSPASSRRRWATIPAASGMGIGAAVWWALSGILAAGAGGWVAARLAGVPSRQIGLLHGLAAWAVATLVVLYLLSSTATALVGGAFNVVGRTLSGVGGAAGSAASSVAQQFGNPLEALQDEIRGAAGPEHRSGGGRSAARGGDGSGADQRGRRREPSPPERGRGPHPPGCGPGRGTAPRSGVGAALPRDARPGGGAGP